MEVDRWSLCRGAWIGGLCVEVDRWSLCRGGLYHAGSIVILYIHTIYIAYTHNNNVIII